MNSLKTALRKQSPNVLPLRIEKETFNGLSTVANRKIALPTMEGIHFEKVQDIVSLEAQGNYTMIYFNPKKQILVCKTLREMELLINSEHQFIRVHRSFTINLNCIQKYIKGKGGYVIMEDGTSISVSSGKKQDFIDALKIYFG